jgi:glutathione S-transferase
MGPVHSSHDSLKVYYDPKSTNSLRVLMYLSEADLKHAELCKISLEQGDHKSEAYVKLNPRMQVPFLVHDRVRMNESVAIIEYLGRIFPNESLFPVKDHEGCALNCKYIAEFHQKLDPLNILGSVVWGKKTRSEIGEQRIQALFRELDVWEDYLAEENPYLLGNQVSTSDIIIFPNIACFFWLLGLSQTEYPFLARWYQRMRERPSCKDLEFWTALQPKLEWTSVLADRNL